MSHVLMYDGIPVLTDDTMYPGGFHDFEAYIRALEVQHPLWQPGTRVRRSPLCHSS